MSLWWVEGCWIQWRDCTFQIFLYLHLCLCFCVRLECWTMNLWVWCTQIGAMC